MELEADPCRMGFRYMGHNLLPPHGFRYLPILPTFLLGQPSIDIWSDREYFLDKLSPELSMVVHLLIQQPSSIRDLQRDHCRDVVDNICNDGTIDLNAIKHRRGYLNEGRILAILRVVDHS